MAADFFDRLASQIDRLDPANRRAFMERLSRERSMLMTILESIGDGVMMLDATGRLAFANHAAERMLGHDAKNLKGRRLARFFGDIDWDPASDVDWRGGDGSEWPRVFAREIEVTYPERRVLSFRAVPMVDGEAASGNRLLVILRDVTSERDREASALEGERLDAVKTLAAGVAHEIGNPLNALNIHLQLLGRQLRSLPAAERAPLQELVGVAGEEVARLDGIITQFLSAVRPRKPDMRPCDVVSLLKDALRLMHVDIENREIEVAVSAPSSVPALLIDPGQIKQVFFNLIKNAMEAMPDGGRLSIVLAPGDVFVRIEFQDNGVGIAEDELGRIFEPYRTTKKKGTGLGLMIVQRIVRDHGGQIEVSSKPGEGTRFGILLPRAERRVRKLTSSGSR